MQHPIQIDSAGGEYMEAVLVLEWAVAPGAAVTAGQVLVTVETAKAATEIPAPADGFLSQILFAAGQEAPVGQVLGYVSTERAAASPTAPHAPAAQGDTGPATPTATATPIASVPQAVDRLRSARVIASPLARRRARALGVDLAQVRGTGPHGRIKRADVETAATAALTPAVVAPAPPLDGAAPGLVPTPVAAQIPAQIPVVLIHGFGAEKASWRPVAGRLDAARPVVMPELPGHGEAAATEVRDLHDLAHAVADQLHALGIEQAHLVGHSLGGAVAIALADLGLIAARSLCLIAPAGLTPEANTAFIHGLAQATRPEDLTPWLDAMVADAAALPPGMARAVLRQRAARDQGPALVAMAKALFGPLGPAFSLAPRLARLDMPIKVIWGMQDRVVPLPQGLILPAHAALHRLPDTGHVPQIEQPALVARLIRETIRAAE